MPADRPCTRGSSTARRTATVALFAALLAGAAGCSSQTADATSSSSGSPSPSVSSSSAPASSGASAASALAGKGLPAVPGIVREVEPSVVTIRTQIGLGSGVVYKSDGTIVTDAHVVEDQQKQPFQTVEVQFADGKSSKAKVIGVDDITDVAVIKAERGNLPAPEYVDELPQVGEMDVVIGSPLGLTETVTAGIISGLHRNMPPSKESPQGLIDLIQTDAPISPGNSGGAVVNGDGKVIGLSEAYLPPSSGAVAIGFVTPAATVTDVADQLLKSGTVKHAFLGIRPADITPQVAQRFNLPTTRGALVVNVTSGSPADKAGMQAGDVITKLADKQVNNVTDLLAALRDKKPGDNIQVVVNRGGSSKTLQVTLADRPSTSG